MHNKNKIELYMLPLAMSASSCEFVTLGSLFTVLRLG